MLKEFTKYQIKDIRTIYPLIILILVIWLIIGVLLLSCSTKPIIAQDYYICELKDQSKFERSLIMLKRQLNDLIKMYHNTC